MSLEINKRSINNLGGWLMVVQVFIFLNAYGWVRNFQIFSGLLNERNKLIQSQKITDVTLYNYFIYYEIAASIIFTVFSIVLIYIMFKRLRLFPMLFVIYILLDLLTDALILVFFGSVSDSPDIVYQKLIFSFIISVLFISYIRFSKRVKETFVK